MCAQEWCNEVQFGELPMDGVRNLLAAMPGCDAEQPRRCVDDLFAAIVPVVHAFGADDDLRICLEVTIRRERHPEFVERERLLRRLVAKREFGVTHRVLREGAALRAAGSVIASMICLCNVEGPRVQGARCRCWSGPVGRKSGSEM